MKTTLKKTTTTQMDNIVYIEGVGYCKEVAVNRYNESGVNEPYNIYEPIEK